MPPVPFMNSGIHYSHPSGLPLFNEFEHTRFTKLPFIGYRGDEVYYFAEASMKDLTQPHFKEELRSLGCLSEELELIQSATFRKFWGEVGYPCMAVYKPREKDYIPIVFLGRTFPPTITNPENGQSTLIVELFSNYQNLWTDPRIFPQLITPHRPFKKWLCPKVLDLFSVDSMRSEIFPTMPCELQTVQSFGRIFRQEVRQALHCFTENVDRYGSR